MTLPPAVKTFCLISVAVAATAAVRAQSAPDTTYDTHLDIDERHITESPFERSLRVDLDAADLKLLVGVGATADRVDITIRGVHGEAHFRASLSDIRQRLNRPRQPR